MSFSIYRLGWRKSTFACVFKNIFRSQINSLQTILDYFIIFSDWRIIFVFYLNQHIFLYLYVRLKANNINAVKNPLFFFSLCFSFSVVLFHASCLYLAVSHRQWIEILIKIYKTFDGPFQLSHTKSIMHHKPHWKPEQKMNKTGKFTLSGRLWL